MGEERRMNLDSLRAAITAEFPELAAARLEMLQAGWDSAAVEADGRLIFKFPRDGNAQENLIREARLLKVVRPAVSLPVPDLEIISGPPLFSRHEKIKGEHLVTDQYEAMPEEAKQRLAVDVARFYAELHGLDRRVMEAAGAGPIGAWLPPEEILRCALPLLPEELTRYAEKTIAAWQALPPDPHGTTYGFFDGHGWNMAFDHERQVLNGIYDFADSGFGPLQQEFIYTDWISPDLTARIIGEYERLTGRLIDRARVRVLSGVIRLSELAEYADDPRHAPAMIENVARWAAL